MLLALLTGSDAFAQFNQGRLLAGGSLSMSASTNKTDDGTTVTTNSKSTSFSLSPSVGYFFIDNLAAGASIGLSSGRSKGESYNFESSSSAATFGPFVRYYLPVAVFFQASTRFGSRTSKQIEPIESENKYSSFDWGLAAGYAYFLNDFVALEPMIGYQRNSDKNKDSDIRSINGSFYLSAALTVYLGERK